MKANLTYSIARWLGQLTGMFLVLVGFGFFLLFAYVKFTGQLPSDLKVSAFMLVVGFVLVWIGHRFLRRNDVESEAKGFKSAIPNVTGLRFAAEVLAAAGSVAMFLRSICLMNGISWPSQSALYILLIAPVLIGQIILKSLKSVRPQNGVFSSEIVERWSSGVQRLISLLLRLGWLGYVAIPFVWPDISARLPVRWAPAIQVVACCFISGLYATQSFMLHFGGRKVP